MDISFVKSPAEGEMSFSSGPAAVAFEREVLRTWPPAKYHTRTSCQRVGIAGWVVHYFVGIPEDPEFQFVQGVPVESKQG